MAQEGTFFLDIHQSMRPVSMLIVSLLLFLTFSIPVNAQQTCQAGGYTLVGNLKVNGNIESTGSIKSINFQGIEPAGCKKLGSLTVANGEVNQIVSVPDCLLKDKTCSFRLFAYLHGGFPVEPLSGFSIVQVVDSQAGWRGIWFSQTQGWYDVYTLNSGTTRGKRGDGVSTVIIGTDRSAFMGTGGCALYDDAGGDPAKLSIHMIIPYYSGGCEVYVCP